MATGTGKTGFFTFVIRAISSLRDPDLWLGKIDFPKDPATIDICPTKALQEDTVSKSLASLLGVKLSGDGEGEGGAVLLLPNAPPAHGASYSRITLGWSLSIYF